MTVTQLPPTAERPAGGPAWHARTVEESTGALGVDPDRGLDGEEADRRLDEYGRNELPEEPYPEPLWNEKVDAVWAYIFARREARAELRGR